jgi:hypothetical protein
MTYTSLQPSIQQGTKEKRNPVRKNKITPHVQAVNPILWLIICGVLIPQNGQINCILTPMLPITLGMITVGGGSNGAGYDGGTPIA